ncbi:MAG: ion channel [bacterium]
MSLRSTRQKKFEERRHLIGGSILLTLLFAGHYIPVMVTLVLMVVVTWMALIAFSGVMAVVLISGVAFAIPFGLLAQRGWHGLGEVFLGPVECAEISLEISVLFSMVVGAIIWVRRLLRAKQAGFDEVIGACNLYIWIATIYGCLYTVISKFNPHSFHFHAALTVGDPTAVMRRNFNELYYFSFVTQTTLGYGDIIPIGHLARSLAISQAIIGQFYVAVVLTYILNLWIQNLGQQVDKKDTGFHPPKKHTD